MIVMQYHKLGATSPALKIPTWFVQSASLVGYGLTFIRQIQAIIFRIKELKAGDLDAFNPTEDEEVLL